MIGPLVGSTRVVFSTLTSAVHESCPCDAWLKREVEVFAVQSQVSHDCGAGFVVPDVIGACRQLHLVSNLLS